MPHCGTKTDALEEFLFGIRYEDLSMIKQRMTNEKAHGYALQRVNNSTGEAAKFNAIFGEYVKSKEVTKQRIYAEDICHTQQYN